MSMTNAIQVKLENEQLLWKEVEAKQTVLKAMPPRITFETSRRCNLSCRFCCHFTTKYVARQSPMNQTFMEPKLINRIAEELFPTLQYYEATLLGDPFLSPNLDLELDLAEKHGVFFRPTTNGTTLTEANLDKIDGRMDWLKCSFDSHIRGVYNFIRIGARFENTVKKLKRFNKRREQMNPVPYFRVGLVLNDLNVDELPEYLVWCHEELGVDDVEIMGLNVNDNHMEPLSVFDKADRVNAMLDKTIETALDKKYKLRLAFTQMPKPGGDRFVCQKRSKELKEQQRDIGFIAPRNFDKMSYVIQAESNRWEVGDTGVVWSNNMRRQDICEEFFNRPFFLPNGSIEACGNSNTFMMGNIKRQPFKEIWNNELYQDIRKRMYSGRINENWYDACNECICMGVTYDRETSDHRHKNHYRVTKTKDKGEGRIAIGVSQRPTPWPEDGIVKNLVWRAKNFAHRTLPEEQKEFLAKVYRRVRESGPVTRLYQMLHKQ